MMNLYLKCIKIITIVYSDHGTPSKDACVFAFFRIHMGFWLECDFLEFASIKCNRVHVLLYEKKCTVK